MVPENKMNLKSMTTKQKAMAAIIVVILLIVIWQVVGLFKGSNAPAPIPTPPQKMAAAGPTGAPPSSPTSPSPAMGGMAPPSMPGAMPSEDQTQIQPTKVRQSDFLATQQEAQKNYLLQLNELQRLKVEKEIEETNQAIAAAKLATATANKNIGDLLAKPVAPTPPPSSYANQLEGPTQLGGGPTSPPPQIVEETPYVVISVSMEMNKWSAVIGNKGVLYNVSIGDVLPPDGSIVSDINKGGVILKKGNTKRKVSLVSSI